MQLPMHGVGGCTLGVTPLKTEGSRGMRMRKHSEGLQWVCRGGASDGVKPPTHPRSSIFYSQAQLVWSGVWGGGLAFAHRSCLAQRAMPGMQQPQVLASEKGRGWVEYPACSFAPWPLLLGSTGPRWHRPHSRGSPQLKSREPSLMWGSLSGDN